MGVDATKAMGSAKKLKDDLNIQPFEDICFAANSTMLDALDAQCVPNELLQSWAIRENRTFSSVEALGERLPAPVRQAALRFLSHLTQQVGLSQASWYEASALLDIFHLKTSLKSTSVQSVIEELPATGAALVSILLKNDSAAACVDATSFLNHCCMFADHLQRCGYSTVNTDVTVEIISAQERRVLQVLGWRIQVPTTETWINALIARFNVLTRSLLAPSLNWVWQQGLLSACLITMRQALNADVPPRTLAAGLLGIGLIAARLIPVEALQPAKMTSERWLQLYQEIQPQRQTQQLQQPQEPQLECALPSKHAQCCLELLTVTVGADLSQVKEFVLLTSLALRDALQERHTTHDTC